VISAIGLTAFILGAIFFPGDASTIAATFVT
jgi:hypothetical protein